MAALELLKQLTVLPDYIFGDINMPIMGGQEFFKRIKSMSVLKNFPVIVYSTSSNSLEIEAHKKLGAGKFGKNADIVYQPYRHFKVNSRRVTKSW